MNQPLQQQQQHQRKTNLNRLQQQVASLMQQQQQLQQSHSVHQQQQHPLQQVGAVLQQQFRGFRRRQNRNSLQLLSAVQAITTDDDDSSSSTISHPPHSSGVATASDATVAAAANATERNRCHNYHYFDSEEIAVDERAITKLTPKKKQAPLPKSTTKIALLYKSGSSSSNSKSRDNNCSADSLPEALHAWMDAVNQLLHSPEMNGMATSSVAVCYQAGSLAVRTMALPVTLPLHICTTTVHMLLSAIAGIVQPVLSAVIVNSPQLLQQNKQSQQSSGEGSSEEEESGGEGGWIRAVLSVPGTILCVTGNIVVALIAPVLGHGEQEQQQKCCVLSPERKEKNCATESSSSSFSPQPSRQQQPHQADYLDRLRLDYISKDDDGLSSFPCVKLFGNHKKVEVVVEQSNYLLRVNDLHIRRPEDDALIHYIDLSPTVTTTATSNAAKQATDLELVSHALDQLVAGALSMLANHPVCRIDTAAASSSSHQHATAVIHWHPEGATKRSLRQMDQLLHLGGDADSEQQLQQLQQQEILIWSGRFQHQNLDEGGYGRKHGFFLARGCIAMAPDSFVKLLWDNTRTAEYNNYCLGRSTLHCVGDDEHAFLDGTALSAAKVIRSEMRVPFAGITVKSLCVMHVRPLSVDEGGGGFIIVSRSLDAGPAGTHTASSLNDAATGCSSNNKTAVKNEILWGCNVIRSVPGNPGVTELTSLSQVGSSVPSFLAQKIGLMGIADFFKNVRAVAATAAANSTANNSSSSSIAGTPPSP